MVVWILDSGERCDYEFIGIFSSEQNALAFKALRENRDDNAPYPVEVDALMDWAIGPVFWAAVGKLDGAFTRNGRGEGPARLRHSRECVVHGYDSPYEDTAISVMSPISLEHAEKVAIEKRREWLRNGQLQIAGKP